MTEDMQVRNLALNTPTCYVQQVSLFARHLDKSPEQSGLDDIRAYQVYLTNETNLALGSVLIAVGALRFGLGARQEITFPAGATTPLPSWFPRT
jgi:hypothetical protein